MKKVEMLTVSCYGITRDGRE